MGNHRWIHRSVLAGALVVASSSGCDQVQDERAYLAEEEDGAAPTGDRPASFQADPTTAAMVPFDFETGNAGVEVIIGQGLPTLLSRVRPGDATLILRWTTLTTNAWFDAAAPYHPTAIGVYSDLGRRPPSESLTNEQINIAMLYASYRVLLSLSPQDKAAWDAILLGVGLDPNDDHESTTDAIGIGNSAGNAVVAARENDGFNQLGFDDGRTYNPTPYADYTGYKPKNTAFKLWDKRKWQPQVVSDGFGITRVQNFVTPQYALTEPYSYDDPGVFSTPLPAKSYRVGIFGPFKYKQQADEVLDLSANLTDEQKMTSELFDDKINSLAVSAVFTSAVQGMTLLEFIHYDFAVNVAAFDTGIAVWQEKTKWDAVRPFSAIAFLYGDDEITAWGGPGQGTVSDITGNEWRSYLPTADHPEYPSATASFCAAHAEVGRLFTGTDNLGWTVPAPAGSSRIEPGVTPAAPLDLHFATWTEFESECGQSRVWSGVHFPDSVPAGQALGHEIAQHAYQFVQDHVNGNV